MNIISPEFSFLDFDYSEYSDACDAEALNALPACNLGIKGQIEIETTEDLATTEPIYVGIADMDCNLIYDEDIQVTPICSNYKFYTTYEGSEVPATDPNSLCYTGDAEPTETQEFVTNPFDLITSADLEFELEFSPAGYQLQFYIEDKIYIIQYGLIQPSYEYTQSGNVYFVFIRIDFGDNAITRGYFLDFLNEVIDINHGTTSSLATDLFTIADMPAGSYLNNRGFIDNIASVTASTNVGEFFYWNSGQINYFTHNASVVPLYSFEDALTNGNSYRFKFYYTSFYNDMTGIVTFDDGTNPPTTINVAFDSFDGIIDVTFTSALTTTHTITLEIDDYQGHLNGLAIQKIEKYDTVMFQVVTNISGNVPTGLYSKSEMLALISEILGFDFDCEFTSCCEVPEIEFETTPYNDQYYIYKLTPYWRKAFVNFPELELDTINVDCFTYAILDSDKNMVACSNLFEKVEDCCYVTKIEYSNNEDAFGFSYPTGVTNTVQFPFFLNSPKYPTTEKIYKQTNGIYKRLSADIEKEYDCETDYIQESYHDKLITALKHDTLIVTSNRLGFTAQMSQQGDYTPDWNSKIDFTAKAEFKLRKYFNGKNNNCGTNC